MWSALFPGQGSQAPGMGKFWYDEFTLAKRLFEEASDTLGLDFRRLCFSGSEEELGLTANTQPCLLLVSVAAYRSVEAELGFRPTVAAGHSIGEYSAVVAAGALGFADALRSVRRRGEAMQNAVPVGVGGMTAVMGLDSDQIVELCRWAENETGESPVQPANLNAPGQIVISGKKSLLDWIAANFKAEKFPQFPRVKFIALKVSAPFHCAMMKPAEDIMAAVLSELVFAPARFPIVQNVNAQPSADGSELRRNLIAQVSAPVRWIECVQKIRSLGCARGLELGSGKVLSGLAKKIDREGLTIFNINSLAEFKAVETALKEKQ